MTKIATIIHHIGLCWTMDAGNQEEGPRCGREAMREVGAVKDCAIAIDDQGRVAEVGSQPTVFNLREEGTELIDAQGGFVCPGFVDAHTHLVHGGSRESELPLRIGGASYLDILRMGGGIFHTVRETTARSAQELYAQARLSLSRMQQSGVTTVEAKTGYGMTLPVEQKQLEVAKQMEMEGTASIVHTALPAHAIPPERRADRQRFVDEIVSMLPALQAAGAEFVDVFVEEGVFSVDEGRHILRAGTALGMRGKIHADEIVPVGGAQLAAEVAAVSADHLLAATDDGLQTMAEAGVIAVCLPGTSFYLQKPAARARFMLDEAGLAVALGSDYNPGSCPSENFSFTMSLALLTLHMTPEEIFVAATRNAAYAVGRGHRVGIIKAGWPADIVVFSAPNPAYVLTHFGINHVSHVFRHGLRVV